MSPVPSFLVRYHGPRDEQVIGALARHGIAYVPDDRSADLQTFQVLAGSRREAAERVSLALDRQGVAYGTLAIEG